MADEKQEPGNSGPAAAAGGEQRSGSGRRRNRRRGKGKGGNGPRPAGDEGGGVAGQQQAQPAAGQPQAGGRPPQQKREPQPPREPQQQQQAAREPQAPRDPQQPQQAREPNPGRGRGPRPQGAPSGRSSGGGSGGDRSGKRDRQGGRGAPERVEVKESTTPQQLRGLRPEKPEAPYKHTKHRYGIMIYETFAAAKADFVLLTERAKDFDQLNIVIRAEGNMEDPDLLKAGKVKIFAGTAWALIHDRRKQDGWYDEPR